MTVQELDKKFTDNYLHLVLGAGKREAYIAYNLAINQLQIIALNASHNAFRGQGNLFSNFDDALKGYKSPAMKAIINAARKIINEELLNHDN